MKNRNERRRVMKEPRRKIKSFEFERRHSFDSWMRATSTERYDDSRYQRPRLKKIVVDR